MTTLYTAGSSARGIPTALTRWHSQERVTAIVVADDLAGTEAAAWAHDVRIPTTWAPSHELAADADERRDAWVYAVAKPARVLAGDAGVAERARAREVIVRVADPGLSAVARPTRDNGGSRGPA